MAPARSPQRPPIGACPSFISRPTMSSTARRTAPIRKRSRQSSRRLWPIQAGGRTGGRRGKSQAYRAQDVVGLRPVRQQLRAHDASADGGARSAAGGGRSVGMSDLCPGYRRGNRRDRAAMGGFGLGLEVCGRHPSRWPRYSDLVRVRAGRSFRGPRSGAGALFRLTRSRLPIIRRQRRGRLIPACRRERLEAIFDLRLPPLNKFIGRLFGSSASSLDWGMF